METAADPTDIGKVIDNFLPDERVLDDVFLLLREDQGPEGTAIEFETGRVRVPENPQVAVVTKAYLKEYYDVGFGSGYRVQVAIGGVQEEQFGILKARYCFATLYYNCEREMITADFHQDMR